MAYFLRTSTNLSPDHERLIRAISTLKFSEMREKLQKVFEEVMRKQIGQNGDHYQSKRNAYLQRLMVVVLEKRSYWGRYQGSIAMKGVYSKQ